MNKRIEYKVGVNKIQAIFVDTDKGTLIQLFGYSQLKIKHEEASMKARHYVFTHNGFCKISIDQ